MIEANIDNNFDTLNMDCYFNYEKVLEHPRSDKYLKIDACMYIVSCILRYEYGSLNCPSNEELNLAKRCLYFAQANGFPIDAKKQFDIDVTASDVFSLALNDKSDFTNDFSAKIIKI